jgi:hypothetical protein
MIGDVRQVLELFDTLSESDKWSALVEILRRSSFDEVDIGANALDVLADELFAALDSEEAAL